MTIKKILSDCLVKLNAEDFSSETEYTAEQQALADKLLQCVNLVWREICSTYLPQITEENVTLDGGSLDYSALASTMLYPVRLIKDDVKHAVRMYPTCLKSDFSGEAILTYAYMPSLSLTHEDEIEDVRLTSDVISDGALGEYWFQNKVFDLASSYDNDFRSALSLMRYKGRDVVIKAGRWGI